MEQGIFDVAVQVLQNGIKLITIKKDTQLASLHAAIKIGSLYEKEDEKGISHFIEHMLFKGTRKRNNEQLNNDLEQRGGEYNAYTDYTSTVYSVTALSDELEDAIDLISDMLQESTFPSSELEKERGVILAEIRTSKDDVEDFSFKRVNELAFKHSPLRFDIAGEEEIVKRFTKKQMVSFYKQYYVPNNCYISIVSPFSHEEVLEMINKYFANWKEKIFAREKVIFEENDPCKVTSYKKEIEQSTIVYAYTFHNLNRQEELALKILNHNLGQSANSILFRKLREEKGLAYDIYSEMDTTSSVKVLYIYTAVSPESTQEALESIDECIEEILSENIKFDDSTISLMKKVLKTSVVSTIEDATDLGNYVLHQTIDGENIYEFLEDMKNLEKIKREDIYKVSKRVLVNPTIHILLPQNHD
jgi:predicted Zn-dependent peptidase